MNTPEPEKLGKSRILWASGKETDLVCLIPDACRLVDSPLGAR